MVQTWMTMQEEAVAVLFEEHCVCNIVLINGTPYLNYKRLPNMYWLGQNAVRYLRVLYCTSSGTVRSSSWTHHHYIWEPWVTYQTLDFLGTCLCKLSSMPYFDWCALTMVCSYHCKVCFCKLWLLLKIFTASQHFWSSHCSCYIIHFIL